MACPILLSASLHSLPSRTASLSQKLLESARGHARLDSVRWSNCDMGDCIERGDVAGRRCAVLCSAVSTVLCRGLKVRQYTAVDV